MIEENQRRIRRLAQRVQFFDLPFAHVRPGDGFVALLDDLADHGRARRLRQSAQLSHRIVRIESALGQTHRCEDRPLSADFQRCSFFADSHRKNHSLTGVMRSLLSSRW